jgi:hypothetical protein
MHSSRRLALVSLSIALSGCALLGFGPPTGLVEGDVFLVESGEPIPHAEVCVFGMDTTCVRANEQGHYQVRLPEQTISLRFRSGQLTPAASDTLRVTPPGRYQVDCGISGRLVISDRPLRCQPLPGR